MTHRHVCLVLVRDIAWLADSGDGSGNQVVAVKCASVVDTWNQIGL